MQGSRIANTIITNKGARNMTTKDLINKLKQYPEDTCIRIEIEDLTTDENFWLNEIEYNKGSGYEIAPEIVLKGSL